MPVNSVDALKNKFNLALKDKKVTSAETESLIALVKDGGGVTNSERRQIREMFIANADRFEATAKTRMDGFINNEIPKLLIDDKVISDASGRKDLKDPAVLKEDAAALKYDWVNGSLFVNGASSDDVIQGMIGNCYLMAGFAAVADKHPDVIQNAIKDNKDGTYTVRFYETSSYGGAPKAVNVTVDGQLPTKWGGLNYAKGRDRAELWVPLLEKAFAQWKGSYDAVGHGGSAGAVMSALTGRANSSTWLSTSSNGDAVWKQIQTALAAGKTAAAGTHGESEEAMYKGTGIYADHAYSVLGAVEENGKKYVVLRNPWGEVEPSGNGKDDGVFKLDLPTFLKLYQTLYVA